MAIFDMIITGGRIFDGTGCPAYTADIGITDGIIAQIGHLDSSTANEFIDMAKPK